MNINKYIEKHLNQIEDKIYKDTIPKQKIDYQLSKNEAKFYQFISYCSNYLKKTFNNEFNFFASSLRKDSEYIFNNLCNQIYNLDLKNFKLEEFKKEIRLIKRRANILLALISILEEKNIAKIRKNLEGSLYL